MGIPFGKDNGTYSQIVDQIYNKIKTEKKNNLK